ncbi:MULTISPECIES: iron ABC transporter permease [unclassified Arthrobacter]|uniref:ABC transporter permease n=1 Tax=unclassified Arthrobacter TaxID=235627 RepID=UPI001C85AA49|nr:ABC transporter permease subunit [Arthrobacter sp. MAHUQ-56]MBX7444628.1 ABC transporter permease subunit [Arthrobacter sp. MAHUQ-56]
MTKTSERQKVLDVAPVGIPDESGRPTASNSSKLRLPDFRLGVVGFFVLVGVALVSLQLIVLIIAAFNGTSLFEGFEATLNNFSDVFLNPLFLPTMGNTLLLGAGSIVFMLLFAVPFAWLYARTALRGRSLLLVLVTLPVAMPGFIVAIGYTYWLNSANGLANLLARDWFGIQGPVFDVSDMFWMVFLQGTILSTPAFFMLVPSFEAMDGRLEEAAQVSGLSRLSTTLHISLPLISPAIIATAIFYFIAAIEMFDFAAVLGLPVQRFVLSTWLYALVQPASGAPQYGQAAALGMFAILIISVLMVLYLRAMRRAKRNILVTGKPAQQLRIPLSRKAQIGAWAFIGIYILLTIVLPVLSLLWSSVLSYFQAPSPAAFAAMNFDAYKQAFAEIAPILGNTLAVVVAVPTVAVLIAASTALVVTRTKSRAGKILDGGIMISVAIPAIVGTVSFLYVGLLIYKVVPIYTTIWILVLAIVARQIPWANRTISSSMVQIAPELEEAASTSGISKGRTFSSIVIPLVKPALMFSWFWVALLAMRDLTVPAMLSTDSTQLLSTTIFKFSEAGQRTLSSAIGVILLVAIAIVVTIFEIVVRRSDRQSK